MGLRPGPLLSGKREPHNMNHTGRKILPHDFPFWMDPERSVYFVTICCQPRGVNQLCLPGVAEALLDSARVYVDLRKWFPLLFLLMPDHLHMLVSFRARTAT